MKKIFLTLLTAVTTIAISCNKQEIKTNESKTTLIDYGSNARDAGLDPVIELGNIITSTEATARKSHFASELPNMYTGDRLHGDKYEELKSETGAKGTGLAYSDSMGIIVFAMDSENKPIMSLIYKLNSSGGVEIDSATFSAYVDSFNVHFNEDGDYPGTITYGFDMLDSIADQSGFIGFTFSNALDLVGEDDYLGATIQAYNSSEVDFGIIGSDGAKDCQKWVPAHTFFNGSAYVTIPGYNRPCTFGETVMWIISQ